MTNTAFIKLDPIDTLPEQTSLVDGHLLFTPVGSTQMYRMSLDTFTLLSQSVKILKLTDPAPTVDGLYRPESVGTYSNIGGLVAKNGYDTIFLRKGGVWSKSEFPYPQATKSIPQFANLSFPFTNTATEKVQCVENFIVYQLLDGQTSTSADTPSTSPTIWKSMGVVNQNITNITQEFNVDPYQIVPTEALYNDAGASLAVDIVKRIGKNSGVDVNYREVTEYYDGTAMDDSKVDNNIYKKFNNKYYKISVAGFVNIKTIGAKGDGVTDDTNVIQLAFRVFENIYFPKGNYLCNVNINRKINVKGDGSLYTRLSPFDQNKAVFTYMNSAPFWTYNTRFESIGFWNTYSDGTQRKTGVGFTFGFSDLNNPDNLVGTCAYTNVTFQNCYWFGFEKAMLNPSGNIGVDLINCGGAANKYMFYFIDAIRINGEIMHGGCKTITGGEFNSNDCVCYLENTTDGFGQIIFRNVIFESNKIVLYSHSTKRFYSPIVFDGCWDELNGYYYKPDENVELDVWTNNIVSKVNIPIESFIIKDSGEFMFINGRVGSLDLDGNINVSIENCSVEENADYGGSAWHIKNGAIVEMYKCYSGGGFPIVEGIINKFPIINPKQLYINANSTAKLINIPHLINRSFVRNSYKKTLETPVNLNGFTSVSGSVVSDGVIFQDCLEFDIPFTNKSQLIVLNTGINIGADKFFIITIDIKSDHFPTLVMTDGNGKYLGSLGNQKKRFFENKWKTFCWLGYTTEVINGNYDLYFSGLDQQTKLRLSAIQSVQFDSLQDLKGYLDSRVYPI